MTVRTIAIDERSLNEGSRSIDALIASEAPVEVFDWNRGIIEEVLLADGAVLPDMMPLLDSHNRFTIQAMLGSARALRKTGDGVMATLCFSSADDASRTAFAKVTEGHLRDVSVGYAAVEGSEIAPGKSATVAGRQWTAKADRWLRITTKWKPREVSMTPVGADALAKVKG